VRIFSARCFGCKRGGRVRLRDACGRAVGSPPAQGSDALDLHPAPRRARRASPRQVRTSTERAQGDAPIHARNMRARSTASRKLTCA
jgi:hypothetical protein